MNNAKTIYLFGDSIDEVIPTIQAIENTVKGASVNRLINGKVLLDQLDRQESAMDPALIIMQLDSPAQTDLQTLYALKLNTRTQHIPIVMISASADQQLIRQAYDEGVSAYIAKPTSFEGYDLMAEAVKLCFMNDHSAARDLPDDIRFTGKCILLIEDNADQSELMSYALKQYIPSVEIIRMSGRESTLDFLTDQWHNIKPELIILDLYLPTRQVGLSLLDSIRYFFLFHSLAAVPVVVFSSSDHQQDIKASYQHGANAYMVKPISGYESFCCLKHLCHFWWDTAMLPTKV